MADPLGLISNIGATNPALMPKTQQTSGEASGPSFKQVLMQNIEQVNQLQQDAEKAIEDLATGRRDDVSSVMIAKEKADMAFKMLLQVRNKLMDAYSEIKDVRV
ncbi:MAG: flagellar hook-basal body complex protein FliE [Phycisphaeraceae bacterium]